MWKARCLDPQPTLEKVARAAQAGWTLNWAPDSAQGSESPHGPAALFLSLTSPSAASGTSPVLTVFQATNNSCPGPGLPSRDAAAATSAVSSVSICAHHLPDPPRHGAEG